MHHEHGLWPGNEFCTGKAGQILSSLTASRSPVPLSCKARTRKRRTLRLYRPPKVAEPIQSATFSQSRLPS